MFTMLIMNTTTIVNITAIINIIVTTMKLGGESGLYAQWKVRSCPPPMP